MKTVILKTDNPLLAQNDPLQNILDFWARELAKAIDAEIMDEICNPKHIPGSVFGEKFNLTYKDRP